MATVHPTVPAEAPAIPRQVRNLNSIAERAGMTVTVCAVCVPEQAEPNLMVQWEGTLQQLAATGLIVPHMVRRIRWASASSGHATGGRCQLSALSGDVSGQAHVTGDHVVWQINWGPIDYSIEERGDVEVVTYPHEVLYHGSAAALEAAGILREHLPTGKRAAKSRYGIVVEGPRWWARRQPDGLYVYGREDEELARIRCEREAQRCEREAQRQSNEGPASAADWKAGQAGSIPNWIRACVVLSLEGKVPPASRFRLEDAALQRIKAIAERFTRELLAEIDQARAIDSQAPQSPLRLVWSAPRAVK